MNKRTLERTLNRLRTARDASNWQGRFTAEIREATKEHRMEQIAKPLDEAIKEVERELDKLRNKRKLKPEAITLRTPYID